MLYPVRFFSVGVVHISVLPLTFQNPRLPHYAWFNPNSITWRCQINSVVVEIWLFASLKMVAVYSSETLMHSYQTTRWVSWQTKSVWNIKLFLFFCTVTLFSAFPQTPIVDTAFLKHRNISVKNESQVCVCVCVSALLIGSRILRSETGNRNCYHTHKHTHKHVHRKYRYFRS